jgi:hypothetical protein
MKIPRFAISARSLALALMVSVLATAGGGCALVGEGINIELTQDQLQGIVDGIFPMENSDAEAAVDVALSAPGVTIPDGSDRVRIALDITASVQLIDEEERPLAARAGDAIRQRRNRERTPLTGSVAVSSGIRYDNDNGQIFLDGVDIEELDIDRLPDGSRDRVLRLTSAAITRALQETPIYTLEDAGRIGNIADTLLRDITISDSVLRITIGVG